MKKYYIVFDEYERGVIINALNDRRNALIKEGVIEQLKADNQMKLGCSDK